MTIHYPAFDEHQFAPAPYPFNQINPPPTGAWFIYGHDMQPYPIGMHTNELEARRLADTLGYHADIIWWPNGVLWTDLTPSKADG